MSAPCPEGRCDGSGFLIDEARDVAYDCPCRAQRIARARSRGLSSVLPRRYRGVSFERPPVSTEIDAVVIRAVRDYVQTIDAELDAGRGLWFMGPVGTGKTTLAMLVAKYALQAGRSVAIYSLPRLLAEIRETYESDAQRTYTELVARLEAVDLLQIDDLGAERTSPWVLEQLYSLVNARYETRRAIVITTNLVDPEALCEQVGARTASRLIEICGDPLPLFGADARRQYRPAEETDNRVLAPSLDWSA